MTMYASTNRRVPEVDLAQALLTGMAADKGLFMPRPLPRMSRDLLARARDLSYPELAAAVLAQYAEGTFTRDDLAAICADAYDFPVPLEQVDGPRHVMRLDQGPTASFKDFAARFMGRALGRLVRERGRELLILTATSGDTGSAIAHAFLGVPGIQAVVLFPIHEVSDRQRRQMTTLGGNVQTLALDSKFDDCQALVKEAFSDPDLAGLNLTSANSINIGRLLPQSVYYIHAAAKLADVAGGEQVVFSVPSGNFGDLMGGLLAMRSGLPVARFVVATNANDEVPRFLATGRYEKIVPSRKCISNAMNVGHPSNLARVVELYGGHLDEVGQIDRGSRHGRHAPGSARRVDRRRRDPRDHREGVSRARRRPRTARRRGLGGPRALPRRASRAPRHRGHLAGDRAPGQVPRGGARLDRRRPAAAAEPARPGRPRRDVRGDADGLPRLQGRPGAALRKGGAPVKSVIIIGDGMSDRPVARLGGKTPLMVARKPAIDRIAREGCLGLARTIGETGPADSAVANLAVLGYDAPRVSQGRAVLEAASMGVPIQDGEVAVRCNLISLDGDRIKNHSSGHISTDEARELIAAVDRELGGSRGEQPARFHAGISYRHLTVLPGGWADPAVECAPPHDNVGGLVADLMPAARAGAGREAEATAARLRELIAASQPLLATHPVNVARRAAGKDTADSLWFWSPGRRPTMETLQQRFGIKGAVISAVDLIMGLGVYAGLDVIRVEGATGLHDTNYEGKAQACLRALRDHDFVYVHVEASDEAAHARDLDLKIKCIEYLDDRLIRHILAGCGDDTTIAVLPDHPTPVETGDHGRDPVPVAIRRPGLAPDALDRYDEDTAARGRLGLMEGDQLMCAILDREPS